MASIANSAGKLVCHLHKPEPPEPPREQCRSKILQGQVNLLGFNGLELMPDLGRIPFGDASVAEVNITAGLGMGIYVRLEWLLNGGQGIGNYYSPLHSKIRVAAPLLPMRSRGLCLAHHLRRRGKSSGALLAYTQDNRPVCVSCRSPGYRLRDDDPGWQTRGDATTKPQQPINRLHFHWTFKKFCRSTDGNLYISAISSHCLPDATLLGV